MSISVIAFILMAAVSTLFLAAIVISEGNLKLPVPLQKGDSSLGRYSVNWLGAVAFLGALLICLV